jgi:hypothetical protein
VSQPFGRSRLGGARRTGCLGWPVRILPVCRIWSVSSWRVCYVCRIWDGTGRPTVTYPEYEDLCVFASPSSGSQESCGKASIRCRRPARGRDLSAQSELVLHELSLCLSLCLRQQRAIPNIPTILARDNGSGGTTSRNGLKTTTTTQIFMYCHERAPNLLPKCQYLHQGSDNADGLPKPAPDARRAKSAGRNATSRNPVASAASRISSSATVTNLRNPDFLKHRRMNSRRTVSVLTNGRYIYSRPKRMATLPSPCKWSPTFWSRAVNQVARGL